MAITWMEIIRLTFGLKRDDSKILLPAICPSLIPEDISNAIDETNWGEFDTAYGNAADTIPFYLKNLFCTDKDTALNATHQLWCSICHQHAYISPAALPSYPVLVTALNQLDEAIQTQVLDIIKGFSSCLQRDIEANARMSEWEMELLQKLLNDKTLFEKLSNSLDNDISGFALSILGDLLKLSS